MFYASEILYLYDMPWLNGESREVSSAVDRDTFSQDGVQTLHLLPRQNTAAPALLRHIRGGHGQIRPVKTRVCSVDVSWMPRLYDLRLFRFRSRTSIRFQSVLKVILSTQQKPDNYRCTNEQTSLSSTQSRYSLQSSVHSLSLEKPTDTFKPDSFTYAAQLVSFMNN